MCDEESRKRRRCLTAGSEGEDSGCQIGSPRVWNLLQLVHKQTHTHTRNKLRPVKGGKEHVEKSGSTVQPCCSISQEGVNALWWPLRCTAPLSRNGQCIRSNYINRSEIFCFYGDQCESFSTKACQVLNIAGSVMCHCQMDM